jgi:hypothetical protein
MPKLTTAVTLMTVLSVMLLVACSGTHPAARVSQPEPRSARPLPPGFSVPTRTGLPSAPSVLQVASVVRLKPDALHRGPFPASEIPGVAQAIVNQPVPTRVRPLLVSAAVFRPGETLTAAAAVLPAFPHDVLFILQGPGVRAQRLVRVVNGVAAGAVTLPRLLSPGQWALGAEDLSGLRVTGRRRLTGTVLLDLTIFTIARQRSKRSAALTTAVRAPTVRADFRKERA